MRKKCLIRSLIGAMTVLSLVSIFPQGAIAEWRKDSKGWWYNNGNSYYTGWKHIDSNWYYFYSDGYMATNDKIGDYFVNSTGVWTNEITAEEAKQLVMNEDRTFINEAYKSGDRLFDLYKEYSKENMPYTGNKWNIPKEPCYEFLLEALDDNGEVLFDACSYLVGKESKNVYVIPNQGCMDIYQIQDDKKVKTIPWRGPEGSHQWH